MSNEATTEARPAVETIKIKIDGKEYDIPKTMPDWQGKPQPTTMLQACKHVGIEIPHYCYHPKLPTAGNCRMCLIHFGVPKMGHDRKPVVDEEGNQQIMKMVLPYEPGTARGAIACASGIAPGMELYPNSAETKEMREGVLESLLINHPLDCPICDQAGECKLQEYSVEYGQSRSQFVETKVHKPKAVNLGPRITLDDERCVLCTRCIRFTRDIAGDDALGIVNRGSYNTIAGWKEGSFDNNYTLNTVDICPVGALTSNDFRFQMRVWFLKESKSLCTSCGTGCNITVGSREGRVYRYEPRDNDAVNGSWMCDSGRLNYKWIADEKRLKEIVNVRSDARVWLSVIKEISNHLSQQADGSVAIVGSGRQTTEELYLLKKLAGKTGALTDIVARKGEGDHLLVNADKNPNTNGARLVGMTTKRTGFKISKIADGISDGTIRTLIVFGEDVTRAGIDEATLDKLDTLIVSDILPNKTTAKAHYLLPGCAHIEKRGTFVNVKGRLQKFMQGVDGPGDARAEWEFLHELVHNITGQNGLNSIEGLFNQMAAEVKVFNGITWASIGHLGVDVEI